MSLVPGELISYPCDHIGRCPVVVLVTVVYSGELVEPSLDWFLVLVGHVLVPVAWVFVGCDPYIVALEWHVVALLLDLVVKGVEESFHLGDCHPSIVELVYDDVVLSLVGLPVPSAVVLGFARNLVEGSFDLLSDSGAFSTSGGPVIDNDVAFVSVRECIQVFAYDLFVVTEVDCRMVVDDLCHRVLVFEDLFAGVCDCVIAPLGSFSYFAVFPVFDAFVFSDVGDSSSDVPHPCEVPSFVLFFREGSYLFCPFDISLVVQCATFSSFLLILAVAYVVVPHGEVFEVGMVLFRWIVDGE